MRHDTPQLGTILSEDMIFGVRRRERLAWTIAIGGMIVGLAGVGTAVAVLPLKETQAFLTIVDRDTGVATRTVEVEAAGMAEKQAVQQGLLFNYVTDRETYDEHDNDERILGAWQRSEAQAKESLQRLWDEGARDYPPKVYGPGARAEVKILAINPINPTTAQVRFLKTLHQANGTERSGKFYATIAWKFVPRAERDMSLVWENPLGFTVTAYRVNAENLDQGD